MPVGTPLVGVRFPPYDRLGIRGHPQGASLLALSRSKCEAVAPLVGFEGHFSTTDGGL